MPQIRALAVATDISPPASPCGMCRQFIREFCLPSMPIYMYDKNNTYTVKTIGELLPLTFGPNDLTNEGTRRVSQRNRTQQPQARITGRVGVLKSQPGQRRLMRVSGLLMSMGVCRGGVERERFSQSTRRGFVMIEKVSAVASR